MSILKYFYPSLIAVLLLTGLLTGRVAVAIPLSLSPESNDEFQITPFLSQSANQTADYREALASLEKAEYEKVVELGKQYVSNNPGEARTHLILILGWIGMGDQMAIDRHLSELEQKLPEIASAIKLNVAKYYASKNLFKQALDYLPNKPAEKDKLGVLHLQAAIYTQLSKKDKALASYQAILRLVPDDEPALMKLVTLYLADKNYKESVHYASKLVALKPDSVAALVLLGTNQLLLNQPARAVGTFKKVTTQASKNPVGLLNLATAYHALGRYEDAQRTYARLARAYPKIREGHTGLALVYLAQGKLAKSRQAAEKAIAVDSKYPIPHLAVAAIALSENDKAVANKAFKRTGDLYIDFQRPGFDASAYFSDKPLATVSTLASSVFFSQQGYLDLALHAVSGAANDIKRAPFLAVTRARQSWKLGRPGEAQAILKNVSRAFPDLITPIIESADIAYLTGKGKIALRGYQKALQLAPEATNLHMNLGNLYNALGQPDKAVSEYKQYLVKDPRSTYALNQLAATLSEVLNMPGKALPYALDAQKIDPESAQIKDTLGDIYFRLGRYSESVQQYEKLVATSAGVNPKTYYRIGLNYLKLKDREKAVIFLERAINSGVDFPLRNEAIKRLGKLKEGRA